MQNENLEIRSIEVDGETDWLWPASDHGAWDGPVKDWENSHKDKFFKYLKNNRVVVTAGANCGLYTRFFAKKFEWVYAFEPDPVSFYCMVQNNPFGKVFKFNCALGEFGQTICLNAADRNNVGTHTIVERPGAVPMIPLDVLGLTVLDLLQLDVEGYESKVILGGLETIKRTRPVVITERGSSSEEVTRILTDIGYKETDSSAMDTIYTFSETATS